jgi:hypothetical protein
MMQKTDRFVHVAPAIWSYTESVKKPLVSLMMICPRLSRPLLPFLCCLAFAVPGRVLSAEILFFDDFTGPASDLASHSPTQGNSAWMAPPNPAQALQLDGDGRAVFDSESIGDGRRKHAWVNTGATGDEYYVAAECSIDGPVSGRGGWAAVGFAQDMSQAREPLLASTLFAVNPAGGWFLWVRDRNESDRPPFRGLLKPEAGFSRGQPVTLSLLYNQSSGQLESYVNDHLVHSVMVSDPALPVGSAVLAFHVGDPTNLSAASQIFAERFLVSDGKTEMPSSGSAP